MPDRTTIKRAKADLRRGTSKSTAAGEFVRAEMDHIRAGKHGARSTKQAIAIGLAKARRAGIDPGTPKTGTARVKKQAARDAAVGRHPHEISKARSRASLAALKREPRKAATKTALSRHAHAVAKRRKRA
ncbi:hypothetical protein BH11MYX1_BH11MYX1_42150 [soil metagenome]